MLRMLVVFAEFEHDIIQQRIKAGLEAARKRGRMGGRLAIDADTKRHVVKLFSSGESASDITKEFGIGRRRFIKF
ncbi:MULTISPECIES: recombinase family protein [unclassified Sporosarcina]|uniref:recombinase family protein n=1 Tax=unclassified Sporosarcina TaxID=2647733 RepID=UPI001E3FE61B|nr:MULTISPECIES: recombinase family protein [unclassified Sporosarcina]